MTFRVAYFQPIIIAMDQVPPVEFSKIYGLTEELHNHPEFNDASDNISMRGGQQIQVLPNDLNKDVTWLKTWLESICKGYMDIVAQQCGTKEMSYCKPIITSIWTIRQTEGQYQELHSHPMGSLSGNIYITAPEFSEDKKSSDGQIHFNFPKVKDIGKFIMNDAWKYDPTPGTFILFPSYLPHTVYPWKGTGTRTVMAFDCNLVPKTEDELKAEQQQRGYP
jgi:hypothetical protein